MRRLWRRLRRGKKEEGKGRREDEKAPVKQDEKEEKGEGAIKKGIYFSALVYVEGEQAPADDFDSAARAGLKKVLEDALEGEHGGLKMRLKGLEVRNDVEEEEEDEGGEGSKGEKFEF